MSTTELDVLVSEHQRVGISIVEHYKDLGHAQGLGLIVLGAVATFRPTRVAAIVGPIALALITLFAFDLLREMVMLGSYKRELEIRINTQFGKRVCQWESWIALPFTKKSVVKNSLWALLGLIVPSCAAVSSVAALGYADDYYLWVRLGVWGFWIVYIVVTLLGLVEIWIRGRDVVNWSQYRPEALVYKESVYRSWKTSRKHDRM